MMTGKIYGIRDTGYGVQGKTKPVTRYPYPAKAVTIIELIMAMVIIGVLAGVSSMYIKQVVDLWQFLNFRSESTAQLRAALIRMDRERRQIVDSASINEADLSRLNFTALDLNGDGNNDAVIFYRNSGNNELRRVFNNNNSGTGDILADNISGLVFTYYDSNNAQLTPLPLSSANRAKIKRITLRLTAQSGSQSKSLTSRVYPRNL